MKVFFAIACVCIVAATAHSDPPVSVANPPSFDICVNFLDEGLYNCIKPLKARGEAHLNSDLDYCDAAQKTVKQCHKIVKRTINGILEDGAECIKQMKGVTQKKLEKIYSEMREEMYEAIKASEDRCLPGGVENEQTTECLKKQTAIYSEYTSILVEYEAHKLQLRS